MEGQQTPSAFKGRYLQLPTQTLLSRPTQRTLHGGQGALQLVPLPLQVGRLRRQALCPLLAVLGPHSQRRILLLQLSKPSLCRIPGRLLLHQLSQRSGAVGACLPRLHFCGVAGCLCCVTRRGVAARLAVQLQGRRAGLGRRH